MYAFDLVTYVQNPTTMHRVKQLKGSTRSAALIVHNDAFLFVTKLISEPYLGTIT